MFYFKNFYNYLTYNFKKTYAFSISFFVYPKAIIKNKNLRIILKIKNINESKFKMLKLYSIKTKKYKKNYKFSDNSY